MVKQRNKTISDDPANQWENECASKASKIGPSTPYEKCRERLSPFGGLLGLEKFMDLVGFKEIFNGFYCSPSRNPKLGHYEMVYGILVLLFIGFNRIWHFVYIQLDAMLCGIFKVARLPYITTFWRYVDSLGINQGQSLLKVMSALRERVWHLCDLGYENIHVDIDTTVETIYGKQQGGRKGHNTKNRGKKGFRPVLCFIEETREYLTGKLRRGETMGGEEVADLIRTFKKYLPGCVKEVILRADGEFISWESVEASLAEGYQFIFANKVCHPFFDSLNWYTVKGKEGMAYNECEYQPMGWDQACRFVVMRIVIEEPSGQEPVQIELLEDNKYKYRIFVTNLTKRADLVITEYDKRADTENLIGEAKREGLAAIPSRKFGNNYAYFQIVMLCYNIWRSFKMVAAQAMEKEQNDASEKTKPCGLREVMDNTIRVARLKLLFIAAKVTSQANRSEVKYSQHDSRVSGLFQIMSELDRRRNQPRPWLKNPKWNSRHLSDPGLILSTG
ncbi:MAG: IS1380 family transposase [Nitrospiria bacterium]